MPRRSKRLLNTTTNHNGRKPRIDDNMSEKEELWRTAEEIFNKSPNIIQKEILKYINVILVYTEIRQNKGVVPKIGSQVLRFAKNGQLKPLEKLLKTNNFVPEILNYSNRWEEAEEKWGYDKSWTWNSDTPLLAAIRASHIDIVKFLLMSGADPTLKSCVTCDEYHNALELAQKHGNPKMISLVGAAIPFWDSCSYSHPGSTRAFSIPNKPKSFLQLRKALEDCRP